MIRHLCHMRVFQSARPQKGLINIPMSPELRSVRSYSTCLVRAFKFELENAHGPQFICCMPITYDVVNAWADTPRHMSPHSRAAAETYITYRYDFVICRAVRTNQSGTRALRTRHAGSKACTLPAAYFTRWRQGSETRHGQRTHSESCKIT